MLMMHCVLNDALCVKTSGDQRQYYTCGPYECSTSSTQLHWTLCPRVTRGPSVQWSCVLLRSVSSSTRCRPPLGVVLHSVLLVLHSVLSSTRCRPPLGVVLHSVLSSTRCRPPLDSSSTRCRPPLGVVLHIRTSDIDTRLLARRQTPRIHTTAAHNSTGPRKSTHSSPSSKNPLTMRGNKNTTNSSSSE